MKTRKPVAVPASVDRTVTPASCCLSAQEIDDRLRKARRPVGTASVYRALETLAELRLVKHVGAGDGIARYEPGVAGGDSSAQSTASPAGWATQSKSTR